MGANKLPPPHDAILSRIISVIPRPSDLTNLLPDLAILLSLKAVCGPNIDELNNWYSTADYILSNPQVLVAYHGQRPPQREKGRRSGNRYDGLIGDYPLAACLNQAPDGKIETPASHLKIVLLRLAIRRFDNPKQLESKQLDDFANNLRISIVHGAHTYRLLIDLNKIEGNHDQWVVAAILHLNNLETTATDQKYKEVVRNFLVVLRLLTPTPDTTHHPEGDTPDQRPTSPPSQPRSSAQSDHPRPRLPLPRQIHFPAPSPFEPEDADETGTDPTEVTLDQSESVPNGVPTPRPAVERVQHWYTNYRTAVENQRLPYAWDELNLFELHALRDSLRRDIHSKPDLLGPLLTTLMLLMGKRITEVVKLPLGSVDGRDHISVAGAWVNYIVPPKKAYSPPTDALPLLQPHSTHLVLPLPRSVVTALQPYMKSGGQRSAKRKFPNESDADLLLREYLDTLRQESHARFTPGRIQNALANTLMQGCGDKTLVHLITARLTDMPPSGAYYHHYPIEKLRSIYRNAAEHLFGYD